MATSVRCPPFLFLFERGLGDIALRMRSLLACACALPITACGKKQTRHTRAQVNDANLGQHPDRDVAFRGGITDHADGV